MTKELVPLEAIEKCIYFVRDHRVMLDSDLAELYGVTTSNLNLAVRRNARRFPDDFMFQLTSKEAQSLILQIAISKGRGGRRHRPYVFTEQGVAMLSGILQSPRAIEVNIAIMRAFVKMRKVLSEHRKVIAKLHELEEKVGHHDRHIQSIFMAIRRLMDPRKLKPKIGFRKG